jgi:type I restriction enzyme S subunit
MNKSWPTVKLGEVLRRSEETIELRPDIQYRQITVKLWGKGVILRGIVTGAEVAASCQSVARRDQFILSRIDARNGAFGIVPDKLDGAIVSNDFPVFNLVTDRLIPAYLGWMCRTATFIEECQRASEGTTNRVRLQEEKFLASEVDLPSLAEQRRIVARIEHVAIQVSEARALRKQATEETDALVGREINEIVSRGKQAGWTEKPLGDYVLDALYGTSDKTTDDQSGTPIIRMGNIQNGRLKLGDLKYLQLSEKDRAKLLLQKGDVLVNRTNSAELVGKCAVFDLDRDFAFASYIIRLRLDISRVEPTLIARYINSPAGRAYMFNERKQMTGQANVNATTLKALPVAIPALAEQRSILAYLNDLEQKINMLRTSQDEIATELDALMPSTLDKAFRGEL